MNYIIIKLKRVFKDRAFITFVLAYILVLLMGFSQPPIIRGMYPNEYWARKTDWFHCADVVLAGDSRVLCGLSPAEMKIQMPDDKILNYGFGGAWFSTQYMDKVESVLDPDSYNQTIIIGITPHSLTRHKNDAGNFVEVLSMSETDKFFSIHFANLVHIFQPLSFKDAITQIRTSREEIENKGSYYPDGWISGNKNTDPIDKEIKKYIGFYEERLVDPANVDNLMRYVEKWVNQGIKVYGFLPPSCLEMYELENEISGFDEREVVSKFKMAGGIWIETDPDGYVSFDGTHLQRDSALEFTNFLTQKILEIENKI